MTHHAVIEARQVGSIGFEADNLRFRTPPLLPYCCDPMKIKGLHQKNLI